MRARLGRSLRYAVFLAGAAVTGTVVLECATRLALDVARRGRDPLAPRRGEDLHPFLQNVNPPGREVERGPLLAGYRISPPLGEPGEGRLRVLLLGGSTAAFELGDLVREAIERRGRPARVFNLAVPWHTSLHSLYKLWTWGDLIVPDVVLSLEGVNDLARGFTPPGLALPEYRPDYGHHLGGLNGLWEPAASRFDGRPVFFSRPLHDDGGLAGLLDAAGRSSALVTMLRTRLVPTARPAAGPPLDPQAGLRALPELRRNLDRLRTSARALGFPIVFLTMPYTSRPPRPFFLPPGPFLSDDGRRFLDPAGFDAAMAAFNAAVRAAARPPEARVIDLAAALTDEARFRDEVHLDPEGKRIEAEAIAAALDGWGLLAPARQ